MTRLLRPLAGVVVALGLVLGPACSSEDGTELPAPEPSSSTTTTLIDFSEVALAPVPPGRSPPSTRPTGPGRASIAGRVIDDTGTPVPGALVRATYYFDPAKPDIIEALSGPDGGYRFGRLLGGRWRIRAWLPPVMATLEQPSFFLGANEDKVIDLKVKLVPDMDVTSKMAPDPPLVGWPAELAVRVVSQTVNPEGKVERTPVAGVAVTLAVGGSWSLSGPAARPTDADGTVRWTMTCGAEGVHQATVTVSTVPVSTVTVSTVTAEAREFPVSLPSCLSPASTSTSTTTDPSATTTTKRKTTTTRRTTSSTRSARSGVQPR